MMSSDMLFIILIILSDNDFDIKSNCKLAITCSIEPKLDYGLDHYS